MLANKRVQIVSELDSRTLNASDSYFVSANVWFYSQFHVHFRFPWLYLSENIFFPLLRKCLQELCQGLDLLDQIFCLQMSKRTPLVR